jgi:hypothetical protein
MMSLTFEEMEEVREMIREEVRKMLRDEDFLATLSAKIAAIRVKMVSGDEPHPKIEEVIKK